MIGKGSYGDVYLSKIPGKYPVAIKFFKNHEQGLEELDLAKLICGKKHKGFLELVDSGISFASEMPDQFFIVYKYIPTTLKSLWKRRDLSERDIIHIGVQLVDCV